MTLVGAIRAVFASCLTLAAAFLAAGPAPDPPALLYRTDATISLSWSLPKGPGGESAVFNLLLGSNSVYTGRSTSYSARNLPSDSCFLFKLKVLYEGKGWSVDSKALRVSTLPSSYGSVNMVSLQSELTLKRKKIRDAALAEFSVDPCPLAGLSHPEYSYGNVYSIAFKGSLDRVSPLGRDISLVNCDLAKCLPKIDRTEPFDGEPGVKQGRIDVAIGMDWQLGLLPEMETKYVAMSSAQPTLAWTEPKTGKKTTLALMGCRAAPVVTKEDLAMNVLLPSAADEGKALQQQGTPAIPDAKAPSSATTFLELARGSSSSRNKGASRRAAGLSLRAKKKAAENKDPPPSKSSTIASTAGPSKGRKTARGLPLLHVGCFELNCTASALQYLFCNPLPARPPAQEGEEETDEQYHNRINSDPNSMPLRQALEWSEALNYASVGFRLPFRYEVTASLAVTKQPEDDNRRARDKGYLESAAWREAWILSFLAALPLAGATPHFPLLYETYSCSKLPDKFAAPTFPAEGSGSASLVGALPLSLPGAAVTTYGAGITNKGGAGDYSWAVSYLEITQGDLHSFLESYPQQADSLPGPWFRGILFQLIYSLAVARHSFGLHHNGLLSLSNVKLVQVPKGSSAYRQYDCYRTTPEVIAGYPLLVQKGKNAVMPPKGGFGDGDNDDDDDNNGFAKNDPRANLVSGRSTRGDPESLFILDSTRPDLDACVRQDRHAKLQQQRERESKEVADKIVAALAKGEPLPEASPKPQAGSPNYLFNPSTNDGNIPLPAEERTSWCVPSGDTYGLRVKLSAGYGQSSLVRKQLEWWSQLGFSFPNTGWRDDLKDLSISFCGVAAEKVIGFRTFAKGMAVDLCRRMLEGEYALNPAAALRHPLFSGMAGTGEDYLGLLTPESVEPWQRSLYTYAPLTMGRKLKVPPQNKTRTDGNKDGSDDDGNSKGKGKDALYPDDAEVPRHVLLASLQPRTPWLTKKDSLTAVVAWESYDKETLPRWVAKAMPSPPTTFNLFVNGRSVYSGPHLKHAVSLLPSSLYTEKKTKDNKAGDKDDCLLRVQVSAFYPSLGWTAKSKPLEVQARSEGC
jgi:hypothetical protein